MRVLFFMGMMLLLAGCASNTTASPISPDQDAKAAQSNTPFVSPADTSPGIPPTQQMPLRAYL